MDRATIEKILEAGVRAPSGENSQPWRFVVAGDTLSIYNLPDRDLSLYNVHQFGSFVAHGALIENITIAASSFGYTTSATLFPSPEDENYVAKLEFVKEGGIPRDPLFDAINKRMSNRTSYRSAQLSLADKNALAGVGGVVLIDDAAAKKRVAAALSYGDRLLFEITKIHDFLFSHIYWTPQEAQEHKRGFYVKELGLAGPQEATFKLLRSGSFLRFFQAIGFPKVAAKSNIKLYSDVSALGAVIMPNNTKTDFVKGGRVVERLWLMATKLGYDIQPLTAIIFFKQRILAGEAQDFSKEQIDGIESSYEVVREAFGVGDDTVVFLFRIGKGKPLAPQSLRLPPDVTYQ